MSHEVETMAYANAVPWHGLGKQVDPKVSTEEMLVAAGLNWEVNMRPCYANIGTEKKPVYVDVARQALVRSTDNKVLTVTGDNWKPLQNKDALDFFKEYTRAGGATLETAGSLRGGKIVWALANLGDQFTLKGSGGDTVKGYLLLVSPHEVGSSIRGYMTSVRVVCANTLAAAEAGGKQGLFRQNHLRDFDAKAARKAVGLVRKQFDEFKLDAETLAHMEMSELDSVRFLAQWFQPTPDDIKDDKRATNKWLDALLSDVKNQSKQLAGVLDSLHNAPGAQPETAWGVLNAVTHWADHKAGREQDARLFNSWLGDRSRLKREVKTQLLELAK